MPDRPPYWPNLLINWFCSSRVIEEIEGDLLEYYERDLKYYSRWRAQLNYAINALKFLRPSHSGRESIVSYFNLQIRSGLKAGYRSTIHNGIYSLLNLAGLVTGLVSFLFIMAYILDELSYDRYHRDAHRIYRITDGIKFDDDLSPGAIIPSAWAEGFGSAIPEIEVIARISQATRFTPTVKYENKIFTENNFIFIDSTLLNIFDYHFSYKKPGNPLSYPDALIVTKRIAKKYFGDQNPLDEVLTVNGDRKYRVTAVVEMPPNNSFKFDFAALLEAPKEDRLWTQTFAKIKRDEEINYLEAKLEQYTKETYGGRAYATRQGMAPKLQPLTDIHLNSDLKFEYAPNSSLTYVYMFTAIGLIIILVTAVNFINLTTARASTRYKEVAVRKVIGAFKIQITLQLLLESLMFVFIAFALATVVFIALTPAFNNWIDREINLPDLMGFSHWMTMIAGVMLLGLLAGLYPALMLSTYSFRSQNSFRGIQRSTRIRNLLVLCQFVLSSLMLIGAIVIYRQLDLFVNSELGFDRSTNIILRVPDAEVKKKHESFRSELLQNASIRNVSFVQTYPGEREKMAVLVYQSETGDETTIIPTFLTDLNFIGTLGIEVVAGRDFDPTRANDANTCLINRKTAQLMGWTEEQALTKEMQAISLKMSGRVIGVVENFNFSSLHHEIEPVVIFPILQFPTGFNSAIVNIEKGKIEETLPVIEHTWRQFSVESPFDYALLDDNLELLYFDDLQKGKVFRAFVFLSVFISCLGLFALTLHNLDRRTKEISIRKVLGASIQNLTFRMTGGFLRLVFIANLISIPIAWRLAQNWLNEFSYRIELGPDIFIMAVGFSLTIAFLTVITITVRKALINPARQLRYE